MRTLRSAYTPGVFLFVVFFVIGLAVHRDFGIAWDEFPQRELGKLSYDYVFHHDTALLTYCDRDYGSVFEVILTGLERSLGYSELSNIFAMRHMASHTFFLLAALCMYILCYRLFKKRFVAALGFLGLVCMPRLYAHSFFNSKDIPLLCSVIFCFTTAQIAFEKNNRSWYLLLGFCCGFALALRPTAIMLPAAFSCFLVLDIFRAAIRKDKVWAIVFNLILFLACFCLTVYALWPSLWGGNPLKNFLAIFHTFSHFSRWNSSVLLMGKTLASTNLPWYYVPAWIVITVPELWLASGIAGISLVLISFARKPMIFIGNTPSRHFILYILFFFVPVAAVIKLHSIVYDDWRQLYFIFPAFLLLALYAIDRLMQTKARKVVTALCIIQLMMPVAFLVANHPFGQVYFNHLVSHKPEHLRKNYDYDYWGCSYRQAIEYILVHDTSHTVRIYETSTPVSLNARALPSSLRDRVQLVSDKKEYPYYYPVNFRFHPNDYQYALIYHDLKAGNSTICRIYKVTGPE